MSRGSSIKSAILNYIHHFSFYDYMAFMWLIILFFVLVIMAIIVSKKSQIFSVFTIFISLILITVGPFVLKHYLDLIIRPTLNKTIDIKKLTFSNTLIVKGFTKNISKKQFSTCKIDISVIKNGENVIKNFANKLKPFLKKTIHINTLLEVNASTEFRAVFDNYKYTKEINVSIQSTCY